MTARDWVVRLLSDMHTLGHEVHIFGRYDCKKAMCLTRMC